jgi:hypothetical protein
VIEVDDDGFVFDVVNADRQGLALRVLGHQHGVGLLGVGRNLLLGAFGKP